MCRSLTAWSRSKTPARTEPARPRRSTAPTPRPSFPPLHTLQPPTLAALRRPSSRKGLRPRQRVWRWQLPPAWPAAGAALVAAAAAAAPTYPLARAAGSSYASRGLSSSPATAADALATKRKAVDQKPAGQGGSATPARPTHRRRSRHRRRRPPRAPPNNRCPFVFRHAPHAQPERLTPSPLCQSKTSP